MFLKITETMKALHNLHNPLKSYLNTVLSGDHIMTS